MTVYIDEVFLLNALMDYLLLVCAGRVAGEELRRGRMAAAALVGGGYAAAVFLPGWRSLARPLGKLAAALMVLIAYGGCRRLLRTGLIFLGVSAAFGGGVLALQLLSGRQVTPDVPSVLLSAAVCYAFLELVFRRGGRHGGGELTWAELELEGRKCRLTALVDTGNTLTDPHTGKPVMVAEGERVKGLFPPGECPGAEELLDPVSALEKRNRSPRRWRLLPYRAVGVSCGVLLAVRVDKARVGREDRGSILVALSPTPVSDGGGYSALIGV